MIDTPNPAPAGEPNTDTDGQPDVGASNPPVDVPDANALAARLRKSDKALQLAQQRLTAFEKQQADKATADMSEVEKLKAERDGYMKQAEETSARFIETQKHNAFRLAAQSAGAVDVAAALKLADLSGIDIDGDTVTGVESAIKALKKSSPYLFGQPPATAGSGGGNPSNGAPSITSSQLKDMNLKQLSELEKDLASGKIKL